MARNGSGTYNLPSGSLVADGDTIQPSQHNPPLQDIAEDLNTARPVVAGGTGANSADAARDNLVVEASFATRAAATDATTGKTGSATYIRVAGLRYVYNASGTALTTGDGRKWYPADDVTPSHWDVDATGATDAAAAFVSALAYSETIRVLAGTYLIDTPIVVNTAARVSCDAEVTFNMGDAVAGDYCFSFIGGGDLALTDTSLTSSVARNAKQIPVADVSDYSAGDIIRLKSDEPAGTGVTGDSGFAPKTKGEYLFIESISGSNLVLMSRTRDSYSTSGFTTSVRKMDMLDGVEFHGGKWIGAGGGDAAGETNPEGPQAVYIEAAVNVVMEGHSADNFGDNLYCVRNVINAFCAPVDVAGFNPSDATNQPMPETFWSISLLVLSCQDVKYQGGNHRRLRRPVDPTTVTGDVVCRDVTQIGCTFSDCLQGIGTHQVDGFTATGNVGSCQKGIQFRGLNGSFVGNTLTLLGSATESEYFIRIGSAPQDGDYTDDTTSGTVLFSGNTFLGSAEYGLLVQNSFDYINVSGHSFPECTLNGFAAFGKQMGRLIVDDCEFGGIESFDTASHVGFIANPTAGPLESLDHFSARNVTTKSKFRRGIAIMGTGVGAGAGNIVVDNLDMEFVDEREIFFQSTSSSPPGDAGNFARPPKIGRITNGNPSASPDFVRAAPGGFAPILPQKVGASDVVWSPDATIADPFDGQITYLAGQRIYYNDAGAGTAEGLVIITSGTNANAGALTGSITATETELTINDASLLHVGARILIVGAGTGGADLSTHVVSKNGTAIEIADAAITTVAAADIDFVAPTSKEFGSIEA